MLNMNLYLQAFECSMQNNQHCTEALEPEVGAEASLSNRTYFERLLTKMCRLLCCLGVVAKRRKVLPERSMFDFLMHVLE